MLLDVPIFTSYFFRLVLVQGIFRLVLVQGILWRGWITRGRFACMVFCPAHPLRGWGIANESITGTADRVI